MIAVSGDYYIIFRFTVNTVGLLSTHTGHTDLTETKHILCDSLSKDIIYAYSGHWRRAIEKTFFLVTLFSPLHCYSGQANGEHYGKKRIVCN